MKEGKRERERESGQAAKIDSEKEVCLKTGKEHINGKKASLLEMKIR